MFATFLMTTKLETELEKLLKTLTEPDEQQIAKRLLSESRILLRHKKNRKLVLAAIGEGFCVLSDISEHTGIPYATVHRIVNSLIQQKKISETKYKTLHSVGASKRLFFLIK